MIFLTTKKYNALITRIEHLEKHLGGGHIKSPEKKKRVFHPQFTIEEAIMEVMSSGEIMDRHQVRRAVSRLLGRRVPYNTISPALYRLKPKIRRVSKGQFQIISDIREAA